MSSESNDLLNISQQLQPQAPIRSSTPNQIPLQGHTLKSDLLIIGSKVYSDAAFKGKNVPGLMQGSAATGVGVYLSLQHDQIEINVQLQASTLVENWALVTGQYSH